LLDAVRYDRIFSFSYSPRPGTGAIKHGDPVPAEEKNRRLQILQKRHLDIQKELMQARVGKRFNLLVDQVKPGDRYPMAGRTRDNILVHVDVETGSPERYYGQVLQVEIFEAGTHALRGRPTGVPISQLAEEPQTANV
jgi:tRNA-2-methylthio-N6-dimethylallyladenosine synthase